ncbi:MAG: hypothetical protein WCO79_00385 [bacterium]
MNVIVPSPAPDPGVLCIDLGNTFMVKHGGIPYIQPSAAIVVRFLIHGIFGPENVHLVSRVDADQEKRTKDWFSENGIYKLTDLRRENVHFCREREGQAPICQRLGATHMIDDRPEVMYHLPFVPNRLLFNPDSGDMAKWESKLGNIKIVASWPHVGQLLLPPHLMDELITKE